MFDGENSSFPAFVYSPVFISSTVNQMYGSGDLARDVL